MRSTHDQFTALVFAVADYAERSLARAEERRRKRSLLRWFDSSAERGKRPGPGFGSWF
ncbi:hypothetical protein [Glycomyces buryatensis]|uniref:hypothetical protein n=1 Tax=Glycomyces buryatensis TaxID=2570927 RepID=UPI001456279E|nr:hypothetical protein [Glycomyces buryatensis]